TRLSIIDPEGGRQPMGVEDGNLCVAFNGEIFNHVELRRELESAGHVFHTRSDTEVLLRAYVEYGVQCVEHFNGQWAFALWDARNQRLVLSRDRIGVRPLYFGRTHRALVFASELKAIFRHPDVQRRIDPIGLDQVFTFWVTLPPRTLFEGI